MATLEEHGGACCGVRHIFGMDNTSVDELTRLVASVDNMENVGRDSSCRLIEIILSERQVTGHRNDPSVAAAGGWAVVLRNLGFRLVSAFNNANSSRNCYVFHRAVQNRTLPFEWPEFFNRPAPPPPPVVREVPAPVQDVQILYQNVFAGGRRGGMYDTRAQAREAAPRCRRMDRIVFRSDGSSRTEENV